MDNVYKMNCNKCFNCKIGQELGEFDRDLDCFNCEISQELNAFNRDLVGLDDFCMDMANILERIGQIAQSKNVSKKQRIKAMGIMERHSATMRIIMSVMRDVHPIGYDQAVLTKSAEFIEHWTGKQAQSAFR